MPSFLFPALVLFAAAQFSHGTLEISRLRCEYLVDPLGLDEPKPRLSWELASDRRGARQTAWQIRAASDPAQLAKPDLWDSGRKDGNQTAQITYEGKPLRSLATVHWQVRAWDESDQPSEWSSPARWTPGLLDPKEWKAKWIGLGIPPEPPKKLAPDYQWIGPAGINALDAPAGADRYRFSFEIDPATLASATIRLAADDRFRCWLNERVILMGKGINAARELDVLDYLESGKNLVSVQVNNEKKGPTGLIGGLTLVGTDEKTTELRFQNGTRAARDAPDGWHRLSFDDASWKPATAIAPAGAKPWGEVTVTDASQALPARMLRHEFETPKPRRAIACLTGLGYHELYLNGKKAGDRVLEPALTDYDKRVPVSYYDVTELLRDGRNAIGLWLGNGRYHAPDTEVPTPTRTYGAPLARVQLHLELEDGKKTTILSDEKWQATDRGPIRENNDYDGETYDARMEMPGWSEPGFDVTGWQPASLLPAPKGQPRFIPCPPIRVTERIKPIKLSEPKPGTFVFDFGQNLAGWTELTVKGPRDTTVRLRFAESLREDGTVHLTNMRGARVTDRYILSGSDDDETWEPRFSYHGFRYAEVTGFPGKPTLESLEACVVHSDLEPAGSWTSSNETVNRILENTRWGLRGNYLSIPTDCPQRDERQGWLGDRANESRGEAYLFDTAAFYTKWLDDVRDSQREDGCVSDVCPPYWPFYSGSAVWPAVQTIVPNTLHEIFGDLRSSRRHYPGVAMWLEFQLGRIGEDGLLPPDPYGDRCAPPRDPNLVHAKSPDVVTDRQLVSNCYLAAQLGFAARMSRLAGKPEDAEKWLAARKKLTDALLKEFWNADIASFANGTQTSSILPLAFDLVPADSRPALARSLVARIRGADRSHIATGLVGTQWLMGTLTRIGHARLGLEIASRNTYPSWGYMLEQDATTVWERWNGDTTDPAMNSANHLVLVGDLVTWCYEHLAGIRPDAPGFAHLRMDPQAVGALGSVEAEYRSIRGPIRSSWKTNGLFTWDIQLPANTSATAFIPLPDRPNPQITESGKPLKESPGIKILDNPPPNRLALELPSGRYHFEVR